jgi:hypothetical protein
MWFFNPPLIPCYGTKISHQCGWGLRSMGPISWADAPEWWGFPQENSLIFVNDPKSSLYCIQPWTADNRTQPLNSWTAQSWEESIVLLMIISRTRASSAWKSTELPQPLWDILLMSAFHSKTMLIQSQIFEKWPPTQNHWPHLHWPHLAVQK